LNTSEVYLQAGSNGIFENALGQNRPNPFNGNSEIKITLSKAQNASIIFYDPQGKELKRIDEYFSKGKSIIAISSEWFGSAGVVYYKLEADQFSAMKKMVIVR